MKTENYSLSRETVNTGEIFWNVCCFATNQMPNMMGFSCMKAVYEYTRLPPLQEKKILLYPTVIVYHSQETQESGKRNTIKKYRRSDPICCLTVMEVTRYNFAYKGEQN